MNFKYLPWKQDEETGMIYLPKVEIEEETPTRINSYSYPDHSFFFNGCSEKIVSFNPVGPSIKYLKIKEDKNWEMGDPLPFPAALIPVAAKVIWPPSVPNHLIEMTIESNQGFNPKITETKTKQKLKKRKKQNSDDLEWNGTYV